MKGTSSKHAHEQSITLDPVALTISSRKEKEEEEKEKRRKKEKKDREKHEKIEKIAVKQC